MTIWKGDHCFYRWLFERETTVSIDDYLKGRASWCIVNGICFRMCCRWDVLRPWHYWKHRRGATWSFNKEFNNRRRWRISMQSSSCVRCKSLVWISDTVVFNIAIKRPDLVHYNKGGVDQKQCICVYQGKQLVLVFSCLNQHRHVLSNSKWEHDLINEIRRPVILRFLVLWAIFDNCRHKWWLELIVKTERPYNTCTEEYYSSMIMFLLRRFILIAFQVTKDFVITAHTLDRGCWRSRCTLLVIRPVGRLILGIVRQMMDGVCH